MKNKKTILGLVFTICMGILYAQDRIYFVDESVIDVKVDTVIGKQISYYEFVNGVEVRKTVVTRKVRRILYADGRSVDYLELYADPSLYVKQNKRAFKLHMLSPLLGHTQFSYEQNIRPGRALEYSLGIIGLGNNFEIGSATIDGIRTDFREDQRGLHIGIGFKKYSKPVVRSMGRRYKHLLQGWYIMPKLQLGYYSRNVENRNVFGPFNEIEREKNRFGNLMLYGGKQIVFGGSILLDWQIGMGLGFDNRDGETEHHYVVSMAAKNIAIGGGIRIGFVY